MTMDVPRREGSCNTFDSEPYEGAPAPLTSTIEHFIAAAVMLDAGLLAGERSEL
jgi:hypothetical protein